MLLSRRFHNLATKLFWPRKQQGLGCSQTSKSALKSSQGPKAKDYAAAAAAYERLAALRPRNSIAHQSLGLARYIAQGPYAKAVKALEQALVLNPQLWAARLYLGVCITAQTSFTRQSIRSGGQ